MLSICITCKDRSLVPTPERTLELFPNAVDSIVAAAAQLDEPVEVVVTDWGSTDWPLQEWIAARLAPVPVQIVQVARPSFSRGVGLNLAARHARGDVLFFSDTDILVGASALTRAVEVAHSGAAFFPMCTKLAEDGSAKPLTAAYGLLGIRRASFLDTRGWPEFYSYGPEDKLMFARIRRRFPVVRELEDLVHQWHPRHAPGEVDRWKNVVRRLWFRLDTHLYRLRRHDRDPR